MTYRVLKSSSFYSNYLQKFYNVRPYLSEKPYDEQYRVLMGDAFGWADYWKKYLEATDKFVVADLVINCEPLQKAWAKERGVCFSEESWMIDILEAQISEFKPDIWFAHAFEIGPDVRCRIRKQYPSIRWVLAWDGVAKHDPQFFKGCDQVLSCMNDTAEFYRSQGFLGYYFRFGFEPSILSNLTKREPLYDASFVGGIALSKMGHRDRVELLADVSKHVDLQLWLSGSNSAKLFLRAAAGRLYYGEPKAFLEIMRLLPAGIRLGHMNRGELFGLDMYQVLADSKVTLNTHINATGNQAGNIRLVEATGVATCLVTDWKRNLHDFYKIDEEVVAYRTPGECTEKIKYLLENDTVRRRIAAAGQKKTLENYSLNARITEFANSCLLSIGN